MIDGLYAMAANFISSKNSSYTKKMAISIAWNVYIAESSVKRTELEHWQRAIDNVEDETRDHLDIDVPELAVGCSWQSPDGRLWRKVPILYGAVGGRWCYWKRIDVNGTHGDEVIADTIFNGWSPFFAGMLRIPYDGHVTESLMLINGAAFEASIPIEVLHDDIQA